ncbi:MAG: YncE family protein [Dehalococcoidia bacterium]|nr:YncE family protein [Dehalococcoidia bacterium]
MAPRRLSTRIPRPTHALPLLIAAGLAFFAASDHARGAEVVGTVSGFDFPIAVALTPGGALYVTNYRDGTVSVVDTTTNDVTASISVGNSPIWIAVTPDGTRAYVTNSHDDNVSVISTASGFEALIGTIDVGKNPEGIALSPDGASAFVANAFANTLSVINTTTNTVTDTIPVGTFPVRVVFEPDGALAYVTNSQSGTVSVVDTATKAEVGTITYGTDPYGIAVTPDGDHLYVTDRDEGEVAVIDTTTRTVVKTIAVGGQPYWVAVSPDGARAYVTNQSASTLQVIDTATNTVSSEVTGFHGPEGIAITPDNAVAYVTNVVAGTVSVVTLSEAPSVTTAALPDGQAGSAYTEVVTASGYPAPTFAVTSGTFPPGLTLDPNGTITGKPSAIGNYAFTVTATNAGGSAHQPYILDIAAAPVFELPTPPPPEVVDTGGGVRVPVVNRVSTVLDVAAGASASTSAPDGSEVSVRIPAGALAPEDAEGLTLEVAAVADLGTAMPPLPTPPNAAYLANFVVHLVDAEGHLVSAEFAEPVALEFVVAAGTLPAEAADRSLVLVYWNGTMWVEAPASVVIASDGTATLTAEVTHFTLFSVLHAAGWGTFAPTPFTAGVTLTAWQGGGYDRLEVAAAGAVWVAVDGDWLGYHLGAAAFVLKPFLDRFLDGLPAGMPVLIVR